MSSWFPEASQGGKYTYDESDKDYHYYRMMQSAGEAPPPLAKDASREEVLESIARYGRNLRYAGALQDDREVVREAVTQDGTALQFASDRLRHDRELVLQAVRSNCASLIFVGNEVKDDLQVMMSAVEQSGDMLMHASRRLQADKSLVLAAVRREGSALKYASEELRSDEEVVLQAVENSSKAFDFAAPWLQSDRATILRAVALQAAVVSKLELKLSDRNYIHALIKANPRCLQKMPLDIRKDQKLVLAAMAEKLSTLEFAPESLRKNPDFMLQAVTQNPRALEFAKGGLHKDAALREAAASASAAAAAAAAAPVGQNQNSIAVDALNGRCWRVVGGSGSGGIMVRAGRQLSSTELTERLATDAIVAEKELIGERLHYDLLSGTGPKTGWVSVRLKGKELLVLKSNDE